MGAASIGIPSGAIHPLQMNDNPRTGTRSARGAMRSSTVHLCVGLRCRITGACAAKARERSPAPATEQRPEAYASERTGCLHQPGTHSGLQCGNGASHHAAVQAIMLPTRFQNVELLMLQKHAPRRSNYSGSLLGLNLIPVLVCVTASCICYRRNSSCSFVHQDRPIPHT